MKHKKSQFAVIIFRQYLNVPGSNFTSHIFTIEEQNEITKKYSLLYINLIPTLTFNNKDFKTDKP